MLKTNKIKKTHLLIIVLALTLLIGGGIFALANNSKSSKDNATKSAAPVQSEASIDYGPPSTEERAYANDRKAEIDKESKSIPSASGVAIIQVVDATYYATDNAVEVAAQVINAAEDGGKCSISLSMNGKVLTRNTLSANTGRSSDCGRSVFNGSELSKGLWQVKITYESNTVKGLKETTVEVK